MRYVRFAEESQITFDLTAPGIQTQQMTLEDGTDVEIGLFRQFKLLAQQNHGSLELLVFG